MRYTEVGDGTLRMHYTPIEDMPFYGDWLEALLARRAAFETPGRKGEIDELTGMPRRAIVPYDRNQEQAVHIYDDGRVGIICIRCATPTPRMDMSKMRIGGVVQFSLDEPATMRHSGRVVSVVRKWRPKSVSKSGLGCPDCVRLFMTEDARISAENDSKEAYVLALRQVHLNAGNLAAAAKIAPARLFSAWLDVFDRDVKLFQLSDAQERAL